MNHTTDQTIDLETLRLEIARIDHQTEKLKKEARLDRFKETLPGYRMGRALTYWVVQVTMLSLGAASVTGLLLLIGFAARTLRAWLGW